MEITVSKSEIFKQVEKRSSLEGLKQDERFEDIWASSEEGKFLDTYWTEGCTAVVQLFKRYITNDTVTYVIDTYSPEETFKITATMPDRFNELLTGSITTDVKMIIASHVMYGWMSVKVPEAAKKYEDESTSYANDLKLKILYRDEPVSEMQEKDEDDKDISKNDEELDSKDEDDETISKDEGKLDVKEEDDKNIAKDSGKLATKDEDDEEIAKDSSDIGSKDEDDIEINRNCAEGTLIHKGSDRLKLTQYHECNNYFRPRRDYGRRNECGPCDWQENFCPR